MASKADRRRFIITFHGVGDEPESISGPEREVWCTADRFHSILDLAVDSGSLTITFDDGFDSDFDVALPALLERKLHAIFFVVADRIDHPGFLGAAQIRTIVGSGMTIGLHGDTHVSWRDRPAWALHRDLRDARSRIEEAAGRTVDLAAAPFGAYDRTVVRVVRDLGFRALMTSDRGHADGSRWLLARNTVRRGDSSASISAAAGRSPRAAQVVRAASSTIKRLR